MPNKEPKKENSHTKTITIAAVLGILGGGIVAAVITYAWSNSQINDQDTKIEELQEQIDELQAADAQLEDKVEDVEVETEEPSTTDSDKDSEVIYTSTKYGFQITLPAEWKDYEVKEESPDANTVFLYFGLPYLTDKDADPAIYDEWERNYVDVFAFSAYSNVPTDAQTVNSSDMGKTSKGYYITFSGSQGPGFAQQEEIDAYGLGNPSVNLDFVKNSFKVL